MTELVGYMYGLLGLAFLIGFVVTCAICGFVCGHIINKHQRSQKAKQARGPGRYRKTTWRRRSNPPSYDNAWANTDDSFDDEKGHAGGRTKYDEVDSGAWS